MDELRTQFFFNGRSLLAGVCASAMLEVSAGCVCMFNTMRAVAEFVFSLARGIEAVCMPKLVSVRSCGVGDCVQGG